MNIEYNKAMLLQFQMMTGSDPLQLVEDGKHALQELSEVTHSTDEYTKPLWVRMLWIVFFLFMAFYSFFIGWYSDKDSNSTIAYIVIVTVFILYRILENKIYWRVREGQIQARKQKIHLAEKKYNSIAQKAWNARVFLSDLERIQKVLGPRSVSMNIISLREDAHYKLLNSMIGIENLWRTSLQDFILESKGCSLLQEFYENWQVFHRKELVNQNVEYYVNKARTSLNQKPL